MIGNITAEGAIYCEGDACAQGWLQLIDWPLPALVLTATASTTHEKIATCEDVSTSMCSDLITNSRCANTSPELGVTCVCSPGFGGSGILSHGTAACKALPTCSFNGDTFGTHTVASPGKI